MNGLADTLKAYHGVARRICGWRRGPPPAGVLAGEGLRPGLVQPPLRQPVARGDYEAWLKTNDR